MQYDIRHKTTYTYEEDVAVCHNRIMMTPRSSARVTVQTHTIETFPRANLIERRDCFGNVFNTFSVDENHRQLRVVSSCRVTLNPFVPADTMAGPPWETVRDRVNNREDPQWLAAVQFQMNSPRIKTGTPFRDFARTVFRDSMPIVDGLRALNSLMKSQFKYDARATNVNTPTLESFRLRAGVCQDFAQIQIASLRSIGIPARYVSGYLRTYPPKGQPRKPDVDESHAWVSAWCGAELGWIDIDPTNNCLCGLNHIPVAYGRDYDDVTPMKGVFLGGGQHALVVTVDVQPLDEIFAENGQR